MYMIITYVVVSCQNSLVVSDVANHHIDIQLRTDLMPTWLANEKNSNNKNSRWLSVL